jgi:hypothetical protein
MTRSFVLSAGAYFFLTFVALEALLALAAFGAEGRPAFLASMFAKSAFLIK